jgi:stage II sporulation protein D
MRQIAFALLCALSLPAAAEEIRVEVRKGAPRALLGLRGAALAEGPEGAQVAMEAPRATVRARGGQILLSKRAVRAPLAVRPGALPVSLDGRQLPGRLEIWAEGDGLVVVNVLDLEDYVAAVVASEMPSGWPDEALRAQAVAARTYAVAQKMALGPAARAHLGSTVLDQVYAGEVREPPRRAAAATHGEVLTYGAVPVQAFFSASCGGVGESAQAAFDLAYGSLPYLPGGEDGDFDRGAPRLRWRKEVPLQALTARLRRAGRLRAAVLGIEVESRTASGRARSVRLRTARSAISLPAAELRQILGYSELPSLLFEVRQHRGAALFEGRGAGHGAGLCQWGARGRAAQGQTYREILAHYYPGTEVRRMY